MAAKTDLLAYRAIAAEAQRLLAAGGRLFVELGAGQEAAVRALFTNAGLTVGAARKDLAGISRVTRRRPLAMIRSHSHLMKSAELDYHRKKALGLWPGND